MVTQQELSGHWDEIVGSVQAKYGQITNDELEQVGGDLNQLSGLIQRKTGQSREQVEEFIDECCGTSVRDKVSAAVETTGQTVREGYDYTSRQARRGYDASVHTVSEHPVGSLVTAAGIGMLFGVMLGISIGARHERELSWRDRWAR